MCSNYLGLLLFFWCGAMVVGHEYDVLRWLTLIRLISMLCYGVTHQKQTLTDFWSQTFGFGLVSQLIKYIYVPIKELKTLISMYKWSTVYVLSCFPLPRRKAPSSSCRRRTFLLLLKHPPFPAGEAPSLSFRRSTLLLLEKRHHAFPEREALTRDGLGSSPAITPLLCRACVNRGWTEGEQRVNRGWTVQVPHTEHAWSECERSVNRRWTEAQLSKSKKQRQDMYTYFPK